MGTTLPTQSVPSLNMVVKNPDALFAKPSWSNAPTLGSEIHVLTFAVISVSKHLHFFNDEFVVLYVTLQKVAFTYA